MKKNGFTLIELLAVIVILAIIALIATPIILGIINDAREKANERSVELYASAVRNAIASYQLTGASTPKSFSDLTIEYDGDVKCTTQELYEDGSFYLEGCKVNNGDKEYSYGAKKGSSVEVGTMSICNPLEVKTEGVYTAGDKYECDVDPNKEGYDYIFYVLNTDETSVNLIMDSNITSTGEAIKEANPTNKGKVEWLTIKDYTLTGGEVTDGMLGDGGPCQHEGKCVSNTHGPITAMNFLSEATAGWTNTKPQTISTFNDDYGNTHEMAETFNVNARLPYLSEVSNVNSTDLYLIDYLYGDEDADYGITGRNEVRGVFGYWTLSPLDSIYHYAFYVDYRGYADYSIVYYDDYGIRPVINLSI